jgi:zona occludens toxin
MLTLITGTPGAGKTLFTLHRVVKESIPEKGQQRRPIFFHNVADVDYQFFHARNLEDATKWWDCPDGSLIVFDEAQFAFPQRTKDSKPDYVEKFSTHRHKGFDIFITTQDPMNVDVFIRRMCGRHFHITRILGREAATVYEYDKYQSDPTGFREKKEAVSVTPWKYPKKLYDRYKSATQHTHKARTPWRLYALPLIALGVVGLGWLTFQNIKKRATGPSSAEVQEAIEAGDYVTRDIESGEWKLAQVGPDGEIVLTRDQWLDMYRPVVPGVLHTAPAYQQLAIPEVFPKPLCILFERKRDDERMACRCYTQQITEYATDEKFCRYWAQKGWFDPTRSEDSDGAAGGGSAAPPGGASDTPGPMLGDRIGRRGG